MTNILNYDGCGSFGDNSDLSVPEIFVGEMSSHYVQGNPPVISSHKAVCKNAELFCFPSTLRAFLDEEDSHKVSSEDIFDRQGEIRLQKASASRDSSERNSSWFSNHGTFTLLGGKVVSCSLNSGMERDDVSSTQGKSAGQSNSDSGGGPSLKYHRPFTILDKKSELITSDILDGPSSLKVDLNPPFLDWGQSYLYFSSLAFVTVANTCNESNLKIYKPFTTDTQFYPCDIDEILLGPGEVARICFVFLPQQLGLLSAHIVLQTSSGGFLIHAQGVVIESLYQIQPLVGLNVSLDGALKKNVSLYNPFDDILHVKEITMWISVSSENTSHSAEAVCKMNNFQRLGEYNSFFNSKEWLDIRSDKVDQPLMALRPHRSWEISPHSTETIAEINFLDGAKGNVFGAFSMEVQRSSQDETDIIVIPLEAEVHDSSCGGDLTGSVIVYFEPLPCEGCEQSIVLSLKNRASFPLHVAKITEVTKKSNIFHIKHMDGLLLFPGTVTQIAVITCPLDDSQGTSDGVSDIHLSCKLLVLTNDSGNPQIEIPCQDVIHACSKQRQLSYVGHELQIEKKNSVNEITGSVGNGIPSLSKTLETKSEKIAEADELVLRNWRSQGTTRDKSVLGHDEVDFAVVQVGTHGSKWITVKNPSQQPVLMQLVLNSGTVINGCKSLDMFLQQPLSSSLVQNESARPTTYGFSIADTATAEAYVHPNGQARLGPVIFHPSKRCEWRGSALIRNNLSGVESLSLKGFGGSVSMVVLENSEPVRTKELNQNMPISANVAPQQLLFHMENMSAACFISLSKEFHAINTGDLPLQVRKIEVSGTNCGLDGFVVHTCNAFALEPGESRKLQVSYKTDFSAAVVHRDLELTLGTGIFVIPMKASLPHHVLTVCRKSVFWVFLKKLCFVACIATSLTYMAFSIIHPKVVSLGSKDYVFKTENGSIRRARKPYGNRAERNSKISVYNNIIGLVRLIRTNETSKLGFVGRYSDCSDGDQEQRTDINLISTQDVYKKVIGVPGAKSETPLLQYSSTVKPASLETSCASEAQQACNLTVRVGKEKSKRRRKKRSSGAGITGLLEASSSQSGNSTPSSPMSPILSFAHKTAWPLSPDADHAIEAVNPFVKVRDQHHVKEQVFKASCGSTPLEAKVSGNFDRSIYPFSQQQTSISQKVTTKHMLLSSATFPNTNQRLPGVVNPPLLSRSTSAINPNARAPGSNLKSKAIKTEEAKRAEDKFTYDIWGNHFSGLHLMNKVTDTSTMISKGDSQSFFVMGPQILMQKPLPKTVSPPPILSDCAITTLRPND
ncbi:Transmembrane protein [Thalictrum thalictroides]|uniref:Transmembrane protein n=1 Tax=Thalictrum thalictroides TaxID=46969 RepID=A0A7J6UY22_THATH|nr:Transmembrane protein [Thalictrum thalictroides]